MRTLARPGDQPHRLSDGRPLNPPAAKLAAQLSKQQ